LIQYDFACCSSTVNVSKFAFAVVASNEAKFKELKLFLFFVIASSCLLSSFFFVIVESDTIP